MGFYADLHVHSKYSRATSRDCDLEHMAYWARKKGVSVIGTGDFTHPQWCKEIEEKLVPAEPGLFRLRPELERQIDDWLGGPPGSPTRFMLQVEISTIYKKDDRTRKVHHLIYAPELEKAKNLSRKLARIGNLASDGRPILGLDSRDLLEIALESGEGCYLIPAHIWTPWFAVLGSKSGFDSVERCYGDLASEVFALETGLSSDPAMNRRLSSLDRYTLVSNSDAHSPPKIGREACVFDTELDYFAMRRSLESGEGYGGTVEFFAEEGKYHLDGHRKCGVCLAPEESKARGGVCPVCEKPLTLGVMHRVCELADRSESQPASGATPYRSFIPLEEVLAEIQGVGPRSKAVQERYERMVSRLGSELFILESAPLGEIRRASSSLVAEALSRMRDGRVHRQPGFDGQFGTIRLFTEDELRRRVSGALQLDLFGETESNKDPEAGKVPREREPSWSTPSRFEPEPQPELSGESVQDQPSRAGSSGELLAHLDSDQRSAAEMTEGPLMILAGPGTGKTRTLTHRLAHLVTSHGVPPEQCLAITFTRRAAREMVERLEVLLPDCADRMPVMTFHSFGLSVLRQDGWRLGLSDSIRVGSEVECRKELEDALSVSERKASRTLARISRHKRENPLPCPSTESEIARASEIYAERLRQRGLVDFDDLIVLPVRLLEANPDVVAGYRSRYRWISVDEFQDIDPTQYRLVQLLVPEDGNLFVIGDPDQAIYGFRGADVSCTEQFGRDFPSARTVYLTTNYRSARAIVDASSQMIAPETLVPERRLAAGSEGPDRIEVHECTTDRAEAEFVVHTIERVIGGSTFFSLDSGRVEAFEGGSLSFSDFAVLYRTDSQSDLLVEAFHRSGIPFQKRSHGSLQALPTVEALLRSMAQSREKAPDLQVPDLLDLAVAKVRDEDPAVETYLDPLQILARRYHDAYERFLSELALGVDVDLWDPRAEAVSLLTMHAAKGLEFPLVFIVGCEDGILPFRWGGADEDPAEERRLFFVGMTRARRRLVLTHAKRRAWRGVVRSMSPSCFLESIEEGLQERHQHRIARKPKPRYDQLSLLDDL